MKVANSDEETQKSGCLANGAGCLIAGLIFPFSMIISGWLAYAVGSAGCALPNRCSQGEETIKGLVAMVIFYGGGFGVPLTAGILASQSINKGRNWMENDSSTRQENKDNSNPNLKL